LRRHSRAFLGVATYPVNEDVRERFGLAAAEGALVVDVTLGSPADVAGLRAGDVITSLGGRRIASPDDLSRIVRDHNPGERVEMVWRRGDREMVATVTLVQAVRPRNRVKATDGVFDWSLAFGYRRSRRPDRVARESGIRRAETGPRVASWALSTFRRSPGGSLFNGRRGIGVRAASIGRKEPTGGCPRRL